MENKNAGGAIFVANFPSKYFDAPKKSTRVRRIDEFNQKINPSDSGMGERFEKMCSKLKNQEDYI